MLFKSGPAQNGINDRLRPDRNEEGSCVFQTGNDHHGLSIPSRTSGCRANKLVYATRATAPQLLHHPLTIHYARNEVTKKKEHSKPYEVALGEIVNAPDSPDDPILTTRQMHTSLDRGYRYGGLSFPPDIFDKFIAKAGNLDNKAKNEFLIAVHNLLYRYERDHLDWRYAQPKAEILQSLIELRGALNKIQQVQNSTWLCLTWGSQKNIKSKPPRNSRELNKATSTLVELLSSTPDLAWFMEQIEFTSSELEQGNLKIPKEKFFPNNKTNNEIASVLLPLLEGLVIRWEITFECALDSNNTTFENFVSYVYKHLGIEKRSPATIKRHIKKARESIDKNPGAIRLF